MAHVQLADGALHYRLDGPADAPVLVLSNSLGTDLQMWDAQIPTWTEHFRVLRYDTRGHGQSLVTEGPYSIEQLGHDVLAMLDALDIEKAHFIGLSMGGLIGQWLGINAGSRLLSLTLCNTAAKIGNDEVWNSRIDTVLAGGRQAMADLRDASIARWFTRRSPPPNRNGPCASARCWRRPRPKATPPTAPQCAMPTSETSSTLSRCRR